MFLVNRIYYINIIMKFKHNHTFSKNNQTINIFKNTNEIIDFQTYKNKNYVFIYEIRV